MAKGLATYDLYNEVSLYRGFPPFFFTITGVKIYMFILPSTSLTGGSLYPGSTGYI